MTTYRLIRATAASAISENSRLLRISKNDPRFQLIFDEAENAYFFTIESEPAAFTAGRWSLDTLVYSQTITTTETIVANTVVLSVSAPAHLAAYNAGSGAGAYTVSIAGLATAPQILYPGVTTMTEPYTGGEISLVHAPLAAGVGAFTISYRVEADGAAVASSLPYTAIQAAGSVIRVFADITDDRGTVPIELGAYTIVVAPSAAATLTGTLEVTDTANATGQASFSANRTGTLYWALLPDDTLSADPLVAGPIIEAGTGALDFGSQVLAQGDNLVVARFAPEVDDATSTLYVVLKDGATYSNILKDTTVEAFSNWDVAFGDTTITITVYPADPLEPEWDVLFGDTTITINAYPGEL